MFGAGRTQKTTKTCSSTIPGTGCWNNTRNLSCFCKNCPQNTTRQTLSQPIYFLLNKSVLNFKIAYGKLINWNADMKFLLFPWCHLKERRWKVRPTMQLRYFINIIHYNSINLSCRFPWALRQVPCLLPTLSLIVLCWHYWLFKCHKSNFTRTYVEP